MSQTRILELRTQRRWTQERLAEASGVTVRTLQRLEAGNDVCSSDAEQFGEFGDRVRAGSVHLKEMSLLRDTELGLSAAQVPVGLGDLTPPDELEAIVLARVHDIPGEPRYQDFLRA